MYLYDNDYVVLTFNSILDILGYKFRFLDRGHLKIFQFYFRYSNITKVGGVAVTGLSILF
jgi:hypothetical protein